MIYSEASYFDGAHFAHIAAWQDSRRLRRIRADLAMKREPTLRPVTTPVIDTMDLPGFQYARAHLDSLSPERRAELEAEWNG